MQKGYTHLVFLLDRSYSMCNCWKETVTGLKTFLEEQKKVDGKLTVSLYVFDTILDKQNDFTDAKSGNLNLDGIMPRGDTALYRSFCDVVDETGVSLSKLPESLRPEKVCFVVLTDGGENASNPYGTLGGHRWNQPRFISIDDVRQRITHQQDKYSWDFTFLGADFNAKGLANEIGLNASFSTNYDKSNTPATFNALSKSMCSYRGSDVVSKRNLSEYMVDEVKELQGAQN